MRAVSFLTDFGDAATTLPLMGLLVVALAAAGHRGVAMRWGFAMALALAVMVWLKLMFGVAPALGQGIDTSSPSGHVATAAIAYGGLVLLLTGRAPAGLATGGIVAAVIGWSRIRLHMHSAPEVAIGAGAGMAALVLLGRALSSHGEDARAGAPLGRAGNLRLLSCCVLVVAGLHGIRAPFERQLVRVEAWLRTF